MRRERPWCSLDARWVGPGNCVLGVVRNGVLPFPLGRSTSLPFSGDMDTSISQLHSIPPPSLHFPLPPAIPHALLLPEGWRATGQPPRLPAALPRRAQVLVGSVEDRAPHFVESRCLHELPQGEAESLILGPRKLKRLWILALLPQPVFEGLVRSGACYPHFGIWSLGSAMVPGCWALLLGARLPERERQLRVHLHPRPCTPALHFITLSSDS